MEKDEIDFGYRLAPRDSSLIEAVTAKINNLHDLLKSGKIPKIAII
jgi:hypothetical protein